jgi:hypothetical protein
MSRYCVSSTTTMVKKAIFPETLQNFPMSFVPLEVFRILAMCRETSYTRNSEFCLLILRPENVLPPTNVLGRLTVFCDVNVDLDSQDATSRERNRDIKPAFVSSPFFSTQPSTDSPKKDPKDNAMGVCFPKDQLKKFMCRDSLVAGNLKLKLRCVST